MNFLILLFLIINLLLLLLFSLNKEIIIQLYIN